MWEKLLLKPGYYTVQVVILLDFDWSWEYFTEHPGTLNNRGCELTALMCLAWWALLLLLGAAKSVLNFWLTLWFSAFLNFTAVFVKWLKTFICLEVSGFFICQKSQEQFIIFQSLLFCFFNSNCGIYSLHGGVDMA